MDKYLTIHDLEQILAVSRRTIYYWVEQGTFPKPTKIGGSNRWSKKEIQNWLKEKT